MTVSQLLDNIDSAELSEWMVFFDLKDWKEKLETRERTAPPSGQELFGKLFNAKVSHGSKEG